MRLKKLNKNGFQVFSIAFSLLFLEVIFFKTTIFIHDYLNATLVISYALIGYGIGAVISFYLKDLSEDFISFLKLCPYTVPILRMLYVKPFANPHILTRYSPAAFDIA